MIAETQVLILAATGLVFAIVSMGVLNSHKDGKGKDNHVTPGSHGHFDFNQYHPDDKLSYEHPSKEEVPEDAADIVVDAIGHHYTPSKEEVDALMLGYEKKHGSEPDYDPKEVRKAVEALLIKKSIFNKKRI